MKLSFIAMREDGVFKRPGGERGKQSERDKQSGVYHR